MPKPRTPDYRAQLARVEETLLAYEKCLSYMHDQRAKYSYAIGSLDAVIVDTRERVANLRQKVQAAEILKTC